MTDVGKTNVLPLAGLGPSAAVGRRFVAIVVVVVLLTAVIAATAGGYWLSNFTQAYCTVLAVLGCALLYGQLGLVSLCQWALVGVGGWASLRVYHSFHPPFLVTMLSGGFIASAVGMVWGLPALRMRGLYLALVTLMLAGAFQVLVAVTSFPVLFDRVERRRQRVLVHALSARRRAAAGRPRLLPADLLPPAAVGANLTVNVALCPPLSVNGVVIPLTLIPVPVIPT